MRSRVLDGTGVNCEDAATVVGVLEWQLELLCIPLDSLNRRWLILVLAGRPLDLQVREPHMFVLESRSIIQFPLPDSLDLKRCVVE